MHFQSFFILLTVQAFLFASFIYESLNLPMGDATP